MYIYTCTCKPLSTFHWFRSLLSVAGTKHKKILEVATPTKKRKPAEKKQSDWTDNFEGLWQSQSHDFLVERAFNQLLSRGQSKCCICSLFDVPSPFNTYSVSQLYSTVQCIRESKIRSGQSLKVMGTFDIYMYMYMYIDTLIHVHVYALNIHVHVLTCTLFVYFIFVYLLYTCCVVYTFVSFFPLSYSFGLDLFLVHVIDKLQMLRVTGYTRGC